MGKHREFEHKHVKGETNPAKIKAESDRIEAAEQAERQRIQNLRLGQPQ